MVEAVTIGRATLYCADCRELLPTDVLRAVAAITDPPFGVGNFVQTSGNVRGEAVEWNNEKPTQWVFDHLRRLTKHRIIWGANFFNCFESKGGAIVWDKCQPMPNFSKGDIASCTHFKKTELVRIPWTNFTATHKGETDHPCERPVELYRWCIAYLPQPIASVLDPYMGSGSCGVAAVQMGRDFIGVERDTRYFDMACARIEQAQRQGDLFIEGAAA